MTTFSEERLDSTVEAASLGNGEFILVVTKMGNTVASGTVAGVLNDHVHVRVEGMGVRPYPAQYYSFVPISPEEQEEEPEDSSCVSERKDSEVVLREQQPAPKQGGQQPQQSAPAQGDTQNPAQEPEPEEVPKKGAKTAPGKPSADALPDDIKQRIVGTKEVGDDDMDRVLSDISDAALRSLRKAGFKDSEIYGKVHRISKAVLAELKRKG